MPVRSMQQDHWCHCDLFDAHDARGRSKTPSHGENRGSSPLGSANYFKHTNSASSFDPEAYGNHTEKTMTRPA